MRCQSGSKWRDRSAVVVAATLDHDFDKSNAEFVQFYDTLVQPLVTAGSTGVFFENVGHALEAQGARRALRRSRTGSM